MSNRFYFSPSDSGSDLSDTLDHDTSTLPFPKPLDRSSFLSDTFTPTDFLASLTSRFQTLEDLHTELLDLSNTLTTELVDLVNDNYQGFLTLGQTLSGGAEKTEDVRLGVLAFRRDVEGVRNVVVQRREEVAALLAEKRGVREEIGVGRGLLDIAERLEELEGRLGLDTSKVVNQVKTLEVDVEEGGDGHVWGGSWTEEPVNHESEDEYDTEDSGNSALSTRLKRRTEDFLILKHLMGRYSVQHPLILAREGRIHKIQDVLLSDLEMAIRQEPEVKTKQQILQFRAAIAD